MRRALVIARTELSAFLRARSFLIGLLLPPAMGLLAVFASARTEPPQLPSREFRMAIVDPSGMYFKAIEQIASKQNARTRDRGGQGWLLIPSRVKSGDRSPEALRRDLAEQVQSGEIWAFVEIPPDLLTRAQPVERIRLYAATAPEQEFESWLGQAVQEEARSQALRAAELPPELRVLLERQILTEAILLAPREPAAAEASQAARTRSLSDQLGPFRGLAAGGPLAILTFLLISLSSAPLMQGVIEEKTSRVSEILLSSVSPFELMLGKLLGALAASGIGALLYLIVLLSALLGFGIEIPISLFGWFLVFLVLGALLWGSLFLAIGAACADLKDTQNLVLVAIVLQMVPFFFLTSIVLSPASPTSVAFSLFPPAAPMMMLIRLSLDPAPPLWQPLLAVLLLAISALAATWIAGRIFRKGLLAPTRSATLRDMWRWVRAG